MLGAGELIVDARVPIDDINDLTGLQLSSAESDRIGGMVFERLGRVPRVGDQLELGDGAVVTVLSMEGLRQRQLRLAYQPRSSEDAQAPEEEPIHHENSA
jgi:CBS domain containing-hemolysin-like protein